MSRFVCIVMLAAFLGAGLVLGVSVPSAYAVQETLWQPMSIAGSAGGYSQIDFVDQNVGWASSGYGVVARTTDGGLSWAVVYDRGFGDTTYIGDIAAVSEDCAWATGSYWDGYDHRPFILRTTDGGQSWESIFLGSVTARAIEAPDSDHAFVVVGGVVQATADGGATWVPQPFSEEAVDLCFVDRDHGWARVGYIEYSDASASVWRTTDGGSNWTQLTDLPLVYGGFSDVAFVDADHGYLISGTGSVTAATADGGLTWTVGSPTAWGARICAVDASRAWVYADNDSVRATDDACATWVTRLGYPYLSGDFELEVVGDRGWIVGSTHLRTELTGYSDLRPPVTGHDCPAFVRSSVEVSLSPTDEGSGVAQTWFKINSGDWQEGLGFTLDVPPGTANGTEYHVELSSADHYGNWETGNSFVVTVDTLAPELSMTGVGGLDDWTGGAGQYVGVSAWDGWGGSGVARVDLCLDHGRWERRDASFTVAIPAPLDHTNDGVHTIAARGVDALGNLGEVEWHWVGIDTRRPRARAPYVARAYSRGLGAIVFRIDDPLPCSNSCQATITIKTLGGRKLAVMESGDLEANRWYVAQFYCPLKPGKYRFSIKGVDWSGNQTARQATNYLVVKAKTSSTKALHQMPGEWLEWRDSRD